MNKSWKKVQMKTALFDNEKFLFNKKMCEEQHYLQ